MSKVYINDEDGAWSMDMILIDLQKSWPLLIVAQPEINNDACGWLIKVPKDKHGNGLLRTPEERQYFSTLIETELYNIIKNILTSPNSIRPKAKAALKRIKEEHDPVRHAQQVVEIYGLSK